MSDRDQRHGRSQTASTRTARAHTFTMSLRYTFSLFGSVRLEFRSCFRPTMSMPCELGGERGKRDRSQRADRAPWGEGEQSDVDGDGNSARPSSACADGRMDGWGRAAQRRECEDGRMGKRRGWRSVASASDAPSRPSPILHPPFPLPVPSSCACARPSSAVSTPASVPAPFQAPRSVALP